MARSNSTNLTVPGASMSQLEASATDFHLGVINTSFEPTDPDRGVLLGNPPYLTAQDAGYVAEFKSRVQVGISGADKERGLQAAAHALSPAMALGANAGFLRPETVQAFP